MKIALDAMGGDFAPAATVEGAIQAAEMLAGKAEILLIGDQAQIEAELQKHGYSSSRISIVHTTQVIEMGEHPTKALTHKPDSSIAKGYAMLKAKEIDAFCSAGNTGAMLVGALFSVKAVEGFMRPCIASFAPNLNGGIGVIVDVGANADCKPEVLEQFGEIGSIYAEEVLKIANPKVGLMSLGEEEGKGNMATQAAHQLLKANTNLNFVGNIEGRDLFNDKADVIVCDGFTGNVILKMAESFYDILKEKNIHDPFIDRLDYEAVGGTPILGINGNALIGHGASSAGAVRNMLNQGYQMDKSDKSEKFKKTYSA